LHTLYSLLQKYNRLDATQTKVISNATQRERRTFLIRCLRDIYAAGYKIRDVHNLGNRHVQVIVAAWESRGYSAAAMQKYHAFLNTFARWIGKNGMVRDLETYLKDPNRGKRIRISTADKSWTAQGVDIQAKIAEVMQYDLHVGICLLLQRAFGLRAQEAWLFRPHSARDDDDPTIIHIVHGTKGGRPRDLEQGLAWTFTITEAWQNEILDLAKTLTNRATKSMVPMKYSLESWSNHFYYICRKFGISRVNELVPHGLRHQFANDAYEALTGQASPVRGGPRPENLDQIKIIAQARLEISQSLGHGRKQVTSAYLSSHRKPRNADTTDTARRPKKEEL
jgi:integrase